MKTAPPPTIHQAALEWHAAGVAVVPARDDGSKAPHVAWKQYQLAPPTTTELDAWFAGGHYDGLGVITGKVSGNLEMLEIEGRAIRLLDNIGTALTDNGYGHVWQALNDGCVEITPNTGIHWYYKISDGPAKPNTKLASQPNGVFGVEVLVETRGEGGFSIIAPSTGKTHPTGNPWARMGGKPATIPTLTTAERDALHHIITAYCDKTPALPAPTYNNNGHSNGHSNGHGPKLEGDRPGDIYNRDTDWADILQPHGWTRRGRIGQDGWGWTRPGKNPRDGISATTNTRDGADRLYVFSTSTVFQPERAYDKFAAYTLLHHNGDYSAAAATLKASQAPTRTPTPTTSINGSEGHTTPATATMDVEPVADETFWTARPVLTHIYNAALSRMVGPWGTLGCVLARAIANTPPHLQLPPTIGGNASLNTFIALVAPSGGGKGGVKAAAENAIQYRTEIFNPLFETQPGSGEGIVYVYGEMRKHPDDGTWYTHELRSQALLDVTEVDTLTSLKGRQGSTLSSVLRTLWSGEQLGHAYVDQSKRVILPKHSYRAALLVGMQPEQAGPIFNETGGGTPQRFIWLPTLDTRVSRDRPEHPGTLTIEPPPTPNKTTTMRIPDEATDTILDAHVAKNQGDGDALDGHELLCRLKTAAALAILDSRIDINSEDWLLSETVMNVSNRERANVRNALAVINEKQAESRGRLEGKRASVAESVKNEADVTRVANKLLTRVVAHPGVPLGDLRRALNSRDRGCCDEALTKLVDAGLVVLGEARNASGAAFTAVTPKSDK